MLSILIKSSYSFLHKNRKKIDGWVTKNTKRSFFANQNSIDGVGKSVFRKELCIYLLNFTVGAVVDDA